MSDYIDNVVQKLKRKYKKDELVSHLTKENSRLSIELGKQNSEILHLKHQLEEAKSLTNDEKSILHMSDVIQSSKQKAKNYKDKYAALTKKYKKLNSDYLKLKLNNHFKSTNNIES